MSRCFLSSTILSLFLFIQLFLSANAQLRIFFNTRGSDSDGHPRFPFLRALVSQIISDRSSRSYVPDHREEYLSLENKNPPVQPQQQYQFQQQNQQQQQQQQSMEHIIQDINNSQSQSSNDNSLKNRRLFLTSILTRMLKSVNFTEVSY